MRILVTGGAGFIGSHMADRLLKEGHDVVVVDNESTGRRSNVPDGAEYIRADVTHLDQLERVFAGRLDAVFHIVGQVSLIRSYSDPTLDLHTNVGGTINVLQLCLRSRVPRLLYASSMTVYGHTAVLPTMEDTACCPVSYYGITKYAAERYVHATAERIDLDYDFRVTSFRMYNVYGSRQALDNPYQGVLGIFIGNLLRGEPLTICGDGHQSRDFIYIDDVVDAWVSALTNPATYGGVFNLGSGQRLSIRQLADHVLSAFGRSHGSDTFLYAPARSGEQRHVEADITRARKLLGWEPKVPFDKGLGETLRWAKSTSSVHAT
jgi:UDP-glucose 4-epimerase